MLKKTYVPKLKSFEEEIMDSMGIKVSFMFAYWSDRNNLLPL